MTSLTPASDMPARPVITRFAPSPTGFLHLGHAAAALFAWQHAQPHGQCLLRIEDIDTTRCHEEFISAAIEDLAWLGLRWPEAPMRQSIRFSAYRITLDALSARGLLYPCFCTRSDIARETAASASAPHVSPDGGPVYPGTCRALDATSRVARIASGAPYALRLDMEKARAAIGPTPLTWSGLTGGPQPCTPEAFGDVVLARRDMPASYHLCVTQDDALQGVTLVTRGEDLRPATSLHRLLQALMGWPEPAYAFHPLLCDAQGRRLAKRDGALALRAMRAAGETAEAVRARAGFPGLMGLA